MIKNLYLYIILALVAIYFLYSYQNVNYVEGYRNARVYVGESPMPRQGLIFINNDNFGMHSIYEVGTIKMPYNSQTVSYFDGAYERNYPGYYPGYYSNL